MSIFGCSRIARALLTLGFKTLSLSIVALHDAGGDCLRTWSMGPENPGGIWLRDLLPQKFPQAQVLIFSYGDSSPGDAAHRQAEALLSQLWEFRFGVPQNSPIVMMGHGVGGLIIKQERHQSFRLSTWVH